MRETDHYNYTQKNLLNDPITYQYSTYLGLPFLKNWEKHRLETISRLGNLQSPPKSCYNFSSNLANHGSLADHFEQIMAGLEGRRIDEPEFKKLLRKWVKSFEVHKRIYERYDSYFRPVNKKQFHDFNNYLRYAEIMEYAYRLSKELPYLNVLLKISDTIISCKTELDPHHKSRLAWILSQEIEHVKKLVDNKGIFL